MTQVQSHEQNQRKKGRQIGERDPEVRDRHRVQECTLACCHGGRIALRGTRGTLSQPENLETIKDPRRDEK